MSKREFRGTWSRQSYLWFLLFLPALLTTDSDHVFFFSYIQTAPKEGGGLWSHAGEMVRVNSTIQEPQGPLSCASLFADLDVVIGLLLANFLEALPLAGIKPQRFMLQTGAKNYG